MSKLKLALKRAQKERESLEEESGSVKKQTTNKQGVQFNNKKQKICINYSKTKIKAVDHEVLKNNKVFSLFQENEMTSQVEILRTQILNKFTENGGNILLVTSAHPGEGKTFTAINLSICIAQELNKTVLVVDADLKTPTKQHYDFSNDFFGIKIKDGLSDYLTGEKEISDFFINPGIERLTILPAGKSLTNSSEYLSSSKMESLMKDLKGRYTNDRIIILDGPALLACSDPLVLTKFADGILLVVEAEKTKVDDLKRVMKLLKNKPVIGTVFNKSR